MKKKIAILGSTGSIGKNLIKIILKKKKNFDVVLLTTNKNYKDLLKQAKLLNVKNLIITDKYSFNLSQKKNLDKKIKIFNNFNNFNKIFTSKVDYAMSSISGIQGLEPTYKIIKYTKILAIANKEAIICGWNLISKELKKNKTNFIPVDSEHFSAWYALRGIQKSEIDQIFLTASGGPFLKLPLNQFSKIKPYKALKHPNWKMGNKITIDSSTLMNKVFEIIEAKNIFDIEYKKLNILIHPKSYVHAILKFKSGITKVILHDTNMIIPIYNTLYLNEQKKIKSEKIDLYKLNNLNLDKVNTKRFPVVKILKLLPQKTTLFETVIVSANDKLVDLFLNNSIKFLDIQKNLFKIINLKEFKLLKRIEPKTLIEIYKLNKYVNSKIENLIYK
ncbi:1-deoxy-D-xylulose-5-phosphate reductoisomerase [Pelagibacterales bacterium SAG-MED46]|nr:1-deoxy-D-xylulose-5-phosphate reductoisomerase [Pelagibacterales bacterium SAG-MED46]